MSVSSLGFRERAIFDIEKIIIKKENAVCLFDFGKMFLKLYPSSHLGDYYIGKYYETEKNIKRAINHSKIDHGKKENHRPNYR